MLSLFLTIQAQAFELAPNTLILTHTTTRYHSNPQTIQITHDLIAQTTGPILALTDERLDGQSKRWYGLPLSKITNEFHSDAGEHDLHLPIDSADDSFEVTALGGYLTACLGNTITTLVTSFIQDPTHIRQLKLTLPTQAIYTGYVNLNGQLTPPTPYGEASLDNSMDGLTFAEALKFIRSEARNEFVKETMNIAVLKTYRFQQLPADSYEIRVLLDGVLVLSDGNPKSSKRITLSLLSH